MPPVGHLRRLAAALGGRQDDEAPADRPARPGGTAGPGERVMHLTELAREHGDKPAVIMADSGATLSYAELERRSNKVAHLFRARGLRSGGHIAVLMENRLEFFPVVWASVAH